MAKRIKSGQKSWNRGWRHRDRKTLNRGIERSFRQTARGDIDEQTAEPVDEPAPAVRGRDEVQAELAHYDELVDWHGSLCGSDEDRQAACFDELRTAP